MTELKKLGDEVERLRAALREIKSGNCPPPHPMTDAGLLAYHRALAIQALAPQTTVASSSGSLLRQPVKSIADVSKTIPGGCYCQPGTCQAPVVMGRQTPCLRTDTTKGDEQLRKALQTAIWRLEDMLRGDDGQAWKEAEKALPALKAHLLAPGADAQPTQDSTVWCEYVAGMVDLWMSSEGADKLKTDEDRRVRAIAGIIERRLWSLKREPSAQQKAAAKTLAHIGYTYHGGELWKPPLGERPKWLDYEPAGFLLHWPAPGGGRDILWSKDGAAGRTIGCPVTEIFKLIPDTTKEKTT